MNDLNYQLRTSYVSLLSGVAPVYYNELPTGNNDAEYILINSIQATGFNTECANMSNTTVQLMIVTKTNLNNSGARCDELAGQVLEIILPSPRAKAVTVTDGQVISTDLQLDIVRTGQTDGQRKVVNRILNFSHVIAYAN